MVIKRLALSLSPFVQAGINATALNHSFFIVISLSVAGKEDFFAAQFWPNFAQS